MEFRLTDEQVQVRDMVRRFAEREVAPRAEELDRLGEFPYDLYQRVAELGITTLPFPKEVGGAGAGVVTFCIALEELARADMSLAVTTMVSVATGLTLLRYGSEKQQQQFLPRIVSGEGLGAVAGTEPNAGSDTEGFTTTAREDNGAWVITGSKAFITNPGTKISDVTCVLAVTGKKPNGRKEFGLLLVPAGTPGLVVAPPYRKMGWRSSDTHALFFEDCRVPADSLLGPRGKGRWILHQIYAQARMCLSATSIGVGQACLDASLKYAQERTAFGRSIGHFQMIQDMVAEMAVQLEAARLLTYKAAWLVDQGTPSLQAAATAKYFGTEAGKKAADLAVQVHGGLGFMDECAVSRYYRDIRVATIGDGSSQIQKLIIARELGLGSGFGMG